MFCGRHVNAKLKTKAVVNWRTYQWTSIDFYNELSLSGNTNTHACLKQPWNRILSKKKKNLQKTIIMNLFLHFSLL